MFIFFFFKQKTAYEMRISDWSSDVCSSDLHLGDHLIDWHARELRSGVFVAAIVVRFPDTRLSVGAGAAGGAAHRVVRRQFHRSRICRSLGEAAGPYSTGDRKSTRLNSSHSCASRMPSSA